LFAHTLIGFAEDRIDQLSSRARNDQMSGATKSFDSAEQKLKDANTRILNLQKKRGVLSAEIEVTSQFAKITTLETELLAREGTLFELKSNTRPNKAKVAAQENRVNALRSQIADLRQSLTADTEKSKSLAEISGELLAAQSQLLVRQQMMTQALTLLEAARIEANRQTIYLAENVAPILPDQASYPRSFENTLLAALIFAGIYLMISLTASILREQVTT
jgi:capsular polysaccharide transport system permease protein